MLETFLSIAIFGSFVWWTIITVILLILIFSSEVNKNGFVAFFSLIAYLLMFHLWGNYNLGTLFETLFDWRLISGYFIIGLIYATFKAYLLGIKTKTEIKEFLKDARSEIGYRKRHQASLKKNAISDLKGNVLRWWMMWPISMIVWFFSDLLSDLWNWLYSWFSGIFKSMFLLGFGNDEDIN